MFSFVLNLLDVVTWPRYKVHEMMRTYTLLEINAEEWFKKYITGFWNVRCVWVHLNFWPCAMKLLWNKVLYPYTVSPNQNKWIWSWQEKASKSWCSQCLASVTHSSASHKPQLRLKLWTHLLNEGHCNFIYLICDKDMKVYLYLKNKIVWVIWGSWIKKMSKYYDLSV